MDIQPLRTSTTNDSTVRSADQSVRTVLALLVLPGRLPPPDGPVSAAADVQRPGPGAVVQTNVVSLRG